MKVGYSLFPANVQISSPRRHLASSICKTGKLKKQHEQHSSLFLVKGNEPVRSNTYYFYFTLLTLNFHLTRKPKGLKV